MASLDVLTNPKLKEWVNQNISHLSPQSVHVCDGSIEEYDLLANELIKSGAIVKLNPALRPNSYWVGSDPGDVARVEEKTFICSDSEKDVGPTNHFRPISSTKNELNQLFKGAMQGRTCYVIPFCMGPIDSPYSLFGVQLTDSAYVALNMRIMTRMGSKALSKIQEGKPFVPCLHSVGKPLAGSQIQDSYWPCNPEKIMIAHFPKTKEIMSFGSGYGGNALLGKKCLALRIASTIAKNEHWMAEHMLISKLTSPEGVVKYIAAAFPSACGKTNLAMMESSLPGWKVECVGDDIAWMHVGEDGRLYAINPESGCFGVAPGTNLTCNPSAMEMLKENCIFTNVALTQDLDVWWEGLESSPNIKWNWKREKLSKSGPYAHPNSRFTAPLSQCPTAAKEFDDPKGVPIDAILFGGRRSSVMPLVYESLSWNHGVFVGSSLSSEMTAAAKGQVGKLRHDPFAMLPFCGYHMGDYFYHWMNMQEIIASQYLPKIFYVNWFRKDDSGKFLWPGFGDNMRVLEWIFNRCNNTVSAIESPIGYIPQRADLNLQGLNLSSEALDQLFFIDRSAWQEELSSMQMYLKQFDPKTPKELYDICNNLINRF